MLYFDTATTQSVSQSNKLYTHQSDEFINVLITEIITA